MRKRSAWRKAKNTLPMVLTCIATVGVGVTAYTAAKQSPKAAKLKEKALKKKRKKENDDAVSLTPIEYVKAVAPAYWPAAATGGATIGCIIGSHWLNTKRITALAGSYALLGTTYSRYKKEIHEELHKVLGEEQTEEIEEHVEEAMNKPEPVNEATKHWFCEAVTQVCFEATWAEVWDAEMCMNRAMALNHDVSTYDFCEYLGIRDRVDADVYGRLMYDYWDLDEFEYPWIDFYHQLMNDPTGDKIDYKFNEGRPTYVISTATYPRRIDYDQESAEREHPTEIVFTPD